MTHAPAVSPGSCAFWTEPAEELEHVQSLVQDCSFIIASMSSFPRVITTQSCNRVTPLVGAGVVAVSVGAIWLSVGAWRTGRAQRALRILWEGDQEGQRRTWGLKVIFSRVQSNTACYRAVVLCIRTQLQVLRL